MAPRKKTETKKSTKKSTTSKPALKKTAAKPNKNEAQGAVVIEDDDMFPASLNLGEMLWEYRAKMAEWERAFADAQLSGFKLNLEKADPKYKKLFELMLDDEKKRAEIKRCASFLRGVQERVAQKLGLTLDEFLNNSTVDHDTGVVKLLD